MPTLPSFGDLTTRVDGWVKAFGADPITTLKNIDFKSVGLAGVGIILAVLLIDLIGYLYALYKGTSRSYVPYSRSFALMAADAWENRHDNAIGEYYDPYARTRSLEPLTNVLDSLSDAVRRWGQEDEAPQASFNAPHHFVGTPHPSFGAPQTSFDAQHQFSGTSHPSFGAPQTPFDVPHPSVGTSHPSFGAPRPYFGTHPPSFGEPQHFSAPNAPSRLSNQYQARRREDRPLVFSD